MRPLLLLLAAVALSAESPPAADLQRYEQALASLKLDEARKVVDKLIQERVPSDGKPRPDPLLNSLIGRLYLAAHGSGTSTIYLDQAPIAELPEMLRAPTALDHARALEDEGDRLGALGAYREALGASEDEGQRRRALIGIGRAMLPQDPSAAQAQLLPIASGPPVPERWEARYLLALSSSLRGDSADARQWADQAWADAATAPLTALAPLHVETLRAGLAAAAGDMISERAMLTAANGLDVTATSALTAQLPVCGDDGLRPSDFVIFGFVAGPFSTHQLVPIAASRPEAVLPFENGLDGTWPVNQPKSEGPLGTVFTVRCRTLVSSYLATHAVADPFTEWGTREGLYFASAFNEVDDDHVRAVQKWIDTLATRFGSDSPLLILPRWQMVTLLAARAAEGDTVLPGQLSDLRSEIAAGLRRAGAPDTVAAYADFPTPVEVLAQASESGSSGTDVAKNAFRSQMLKVPFAVSRSTLGAMLWKENGDWPTQVAQLVLDLNANTPSSFVGRPRQAWELTVAEAQRSLGKDAEARATLRSAGIPKDACAADDTDPKLLEEHFSYDDYPQQLIAGGQEGAVLFDFGLSSAGAPTHPRVVYSLPSGIFDQVSAKGFASVRYTAPTRGGAAATCEGLTQSVKWQIEEPSSLPVPMIAPQPTGPVT